MSEIPDSLQNTNEYIDKITLEFLINKTQYNKYLSTNDPKKYEENKKYIRNIQKYRDTILNITEEYCDNSTKQLTTEMDSAFSNYIKTCIKYLEMKEFEKGNTGENENDKNGDTLFAEIPTMQSYWGKGSRKSGI